MQIIAPPVGDDVYRTATVDTDAQTFQTSTNVVNPLGIMTMGILAPASREISSAAGSLPDTQPMRDALDALNSLGAKHGITGVHVSTNPELYGTLQVEGKYSSLYRSGGPVLTEIGKGDIEAGRTIAHEITDAARSVLDLALA